MACLLPTPSILAALPPDNSRRFQASKNHATSSDTAAPADLRRVNPILAPALAAFRTPWRRIARAFPTAEPIPIDWARPTVSPCDQSLFVSLDLFVRRFLRRCFRSTDYVDLATALKSLLRRCHTELAPGFFRDGLTGTDVVARS
jgi:hypothetical protein